MKRESAFLAVLLIILVTSSSSALEVQRVEASGAIYIRADGSIDPPTAELSSNDNVTYSMTGNLNSSIVIEKDNIVFDGAGYAIQGSGSGNGIELSGRNNVTIENVEVRGFYQGILIYNSSRGNSVFGVRAIYNSYGGVCVDSSTNNNVTGNMVVSGDEGITLSGNGGNNSVVRNNIEGNEFYGVNLISTSNNLVESNNVSNCGWHGIRLWMFSCNNVVVGNNVTECKVGIEVSYSSNNNTVSNNRFSMNRVVGVVIGFRIPESGPEWGGAADNYIIENNVTRNNLGIELIYSKNNTIFHNNVEENNSSRAIIGSYFNIWDDGAIGNYWSDYLGTDANHDGIGDTAYVIDANNTDHYPLMGMFYGFVITWQEKTYAVNVISNSTVSDQIGYVISTLQWPNQTIIEESFESIYFYVSGEDKTYGFCRVDIPVDLLNVAYRVFVNGTEVPCNLLPCSNSTHSCLYFNYPHSEQRVIIIPEFPSFLILPLFFIATLLAVIICKRKKREAEAHFRFLNSFTASMSQI